MKVIEKHFFFDKNKKYIKYCPLGERETELNSYNTPKNAEYVALTIDKKGITINTTVQLEQGAKATDYTPHESHKQTILLPCQLMKVGDVKDRLYWDVDEGKYMIEKNVMKFSYDTSQENNISYGWRGDRDTKTHAMISWKMDFTNFSTREGIVILSNTNIIHYPENWHLGYINFLVLKSELNGEISNSSLREWCNSKMPIIYTNLKTPELIETDITERIELPCYNPTTHIVVNSGNIEPSNVKALIPMKASVVTDGLIGWYDARYRNSDDTYLIDMSNNGNDISLKYSAQYVINNNSIEIYGRGYTEDINYTKHINGEVTVLYYIDNNSTNRIMCMSGDYVKNLGWWVETNRRYSNVWYKNKKYIDDNDNIPIFPIGKKMIGLSITPTKIKMYLNGNLIYETATNINIKELKLGLFGVKEYVNNANYKYYSSYIYNRVLSDEEIEQNYLYEKSIQRGE